MVTSLRTEIHNKLKAYLDCRVSPCLPLKKKRSAQLKLKILSYFSLVTLQDKVINDFNLTSRKIS
jgi:hypothetical protein